MQSRIVMVNIVVFTKLCQRSSNASDSVRQHPILIVEEVTLFLFKIVFCSNSSTYRQGINTFFKQMRVRLPVYFSPISDKVHIETQNIMTNDIIAGIQPLVNHRKHFGLIFCEFIKLPFIKSSNPCSFVRYF